MITREHADAPGSASRRNPIPMVVAAVVSVVILIGVAAVLMGSDDGSEETVVIDPGGGSATPPSVDNGEGPAPDVDFNYFDGSQGSIDDFAGRPLVVNFFASWCAPCVTEMPAFEAVHQDLGDEIAFLGMNSQDGRLAGERIAETTGVTYDLARDPDGSIFEAFRGIAMPTTVFIDEEGVVVRYHAGSLTGDDLRTVIESELLD